MLELGGELGLGSSFSVLMSECKARRSMRVR